MTTSRRKVAQSQQARSLPFRACDSCGFQVNTAIACCPKCRLPLQAPEKLPRAKPRHFEDNHQAALFRWAEFNKANYPQLDMLYHVPNGGARNELEGKRLKAQGVRKGVLDINLDIARCGYHGLRIEMKATAAELGEKPRVSAAQKCWIARLLAEGYCAIVCEGWDSARILIEAYLNGQVARSHGVA